MKYRLIPWDAEWLFDRLNPDFTASDLDRLFDADLHSICRREQDERCDRAQVLIEMPSLASLAWPRVRR